MKWKLSSLSAHLLSVEDILTKSWKSDILFITIRTKKKYLISKDSGQKLDSKCHFSTSLWSYKFPQIDRDPTKGVKIVEYSQECCNTDIGMGNVEEMGFLFDAQCSFSKPSAREII